MSEIGGGDDDGKEVGGSGQESGNETESASSAETSSSVEDSGTLEGAGPVEGIGARGEGGLGHRAKALHGLRDFLAQGAKRLGHVVGDGGEGLAHGSLLSFIRNF